MFSGLVERVGVVVERAELPSGVRLGIEHGFSPLELGESIATSGVCLTVIADEARGPSRVFSADLSVETLARTTLGEARPGTRVNLERSLTLSTKLGGHLVTGHVDGRGRVVALEALGEMTKATLEVPPNVAPFTAEKGSLTVEGVSLTINRATRDTVELLLVPHTRAVTTLGDLAVGRVVNLEVDLVARYVARLIDFRQG